MRFVLRFSSAALAAALLSCGSSSDVDGTTWDLSSFEGQSIRQGELEVDGTSIRGTAVFEDEGETLRDGCVRKTSRAEIALDVDGDLLAGSVKYVRENTGCSGSETRTYAITGSRTAAGDGSALTGTWSVQEDDKKAEVLVVTRTGATLVGKNEDGDDLSFVARER